MLHSERQKILQRLLLVLLIFSVFFELWADTSPLSLTLCGWMDHPLQSLPVLSWALTRQHVIKQNTDDRKSGFSSGNRRPTCPQQPVPLHTLSAAFCSHSGETNSDHQHSADVSAMFDPPRKVQVKDTHAFPSGSCGGSSPLFGSSCSSWWFVLPTVRHLQDEKEEQWQFLVSLCRYCVFVEVCRDCVCHRGGFVSLWWFCVSLWRSVGMFCVTLGVMSLFVAIFCICGGFCGSF